MRGKGRAVRRLGHRPAADDPAIAACRSACGSASCSWPAPPMPASTIITSAKNWSRRKASRSGARPFAVYCARPESAHPASDALPPIASAASRAQKVVRHAVDRQARRRFDRTVAVLVIVGITLLIFPRKTYPMVRTNNRETAKTGRQLNDLFMPWSFRIRAQARRSRIGLNEPDLTSTEIFQQRIDVHTGNFPRPYDLGVVDIGTVIHPLLQHIVFGRIAHDCQVFAWRGVQLSLDLRAIFNSQRRGVTQIRGTRMKWSKKQAK